jgi:hypothetical protein
MSARAHRAARVVASPIQAPEALAQCIEGGDLRDQSIEVVIGARLDRLRRDDDQRTRVVIGWPARAHSFTNAIDNTDLVERPHASSDQNDIEAVLAFFEQRPGLACRVNTIDHHRNGPPALSKHLQCVLRGGPRERSALGPLVLASYGYLGEPSRLRCAKDGGQAIVSTIRFGQAENAMAWPALASLGSGPSWRGGELNEAELGTVACRTPMPAKLDELLEDVGERSCQVHLIEQQECIAAEQPRVDRLHPAANAVAAEEEPGADLVHCGARQYRRMGILRPSVRSDFAASQHLGVEEWPAWTYDAPKCILHPAKHRLAFAPQGLWVAKGIEDRCSMNPYLIDNDPTVNDHDDAPRRRMPTIGYEVV